MNNALPELVRALKNDWGVALSDSLSEEEILQLLAERMVRLIEQGPETFFQLMYRLDVSEKKLTAIMHEQDAPHLIAKLVYDRQLQKIKSRQEHRKGSTDDDPELNW